MRPPTAAGPFLPLPPYPLLGTEVTHRRPTSHGHTLPHSITTSQPATPGVLSFIHSFIQDSFTQDLHGQTGTDQAHELKDPSVCLSSFFLARHLGRFVTPLGGFLEGYILI